MLSFGRKPVHHAELLALASLLLLSLTSTDALGPDDAGQASAAPLSILDFGGKAAPDFNNQAAIAKALKACDAANGCTLLFPPATATNNGTGGSAAALAVPGPAPSCPTPDCLGATTYLTSAINLTSHLKLVIPTGVQLRGTEDFKFNCGGSDTSTCDNLGPSAWPVLPWSAYPSPENLGSSGRPVKQAFIRGYNLTNVTLTGGGTIHGGGGWWWCVRMNSVVGRDGKKGAAASGPHAPKWCPAMVKGGKIPDLSLDAPHMLHMISSTNILLDNITITTSPSWTLHFQVRANFERNPLLAVFSSMFFLLRKDRLYQDRLGTVTQKHRMNYKGGLIRMVSALTVLLRRDRPSHARLQRQQWLDRGAQRRRH
jgi:polygalacturonase